MSLSQSSQIHLDLNDVTGMITNPHCHTLGCLSSFFSGFGFNSCVSFSLCYIL